MGVMLARDKKRSLVSAIVYRLIHLPISNERKFKLFLNLEWVFDRLSHELSFGIYDVNEHPFRIRAGKFIVAAIRSNDVILDLGCSTGEISRMVARASREVVGIDKNSERINEAKRIGGENIEFVCADARDYLNKTDTKFSVLILSHILEHLDEPESFLRDTKGYFERIYIEVPDFDKSLLNTYRRDLGMDLIYTDADHVNEFDRSEISSILKNCDLNVISAEYIEGVQRYWCEVKR